MDDTPKKPSSFPNSDQAIPGITDANRPQSEPQPAPLRPTVNIFQALDSEKHKEADLEKIHTFQEDIASAIKNDNLSMIKMALAEKKRQERQGAPIELEESSTKKYVLIGGIAVVVLVFIIGAVVFISNLGGSQAPGNQTGAQTPLLYTEERVAISANGRDSDDVTRLVRREMDSPPELGSIRAILLTVGSGTSTREITSGEFLKGLQTHASEDFIRSVSAQYLLGLYSFSPNDFFIMMKVTSYDTAFAEMLTWEPDIENDLGAIMITHKPVVPITVIDNGSSTVPVPTSPSAVAGGRIWIDRVVNNKDARVLIDASGNVAMLYTFLDKQTLIISSSDKALKEVTFRLTAGRITR